MKGVNKEVYKEPMTSQEATAYIKAIGYPVLILLLSMFSISVFSGFGTRLIAPLTAAMWGLGVIGALVLKSMRKEILKETLAFIGIYQTTLLGWREAIKLVSNVSTEQIMASYNQVISLNQSSALPGYLQTALWATTILVPAGFLGREATRIYRFTKKTDKNKALNQVRGIRP